MKPAPNRGCGRIDLRLDHLYHDVPDEIGLLAVSGDEVRDYPCELRNGVLSFQPDTDTPKYLLSSGGSARSRLSVLLDW